MDGWDLVLLAVAAYLAVMALVRLMLVRRRQLADRLQSELDATRRQQKPAQDKIREQKDEAA